jgi:hypothetical protein
MSTAWHFTRRKASLCHFLDSGRQRLGNQTFQSLWPLPHPCEAPTYSRILSADDLKLQAINTRLQGSAQDLIQHEPRCPPKMGKGENSRLSASTFPDLCTDGWFAALFYLPGTHTDRCFTSSFTCKSKSPYAGQAGAGPRFPQHVHLESLQPTSLLTSENQILVWRGTQLNLLLTTVYMVSSALPAKYPQFSSPECHATRVCPSATFVSGSVCFSLPLQRPTVHRGIGLRVPHGFWDKLKSEHTPYSIGVQLPDGSSSATNVQKRCVLLRCSLTHKRRLQVKEQSSGPFEDTSLRPAPASFRPARTKPRRWAH